MFKLRFAIPLLALSACQVPPPEVHHSLVEGPEMRRVNPSDIAVLPIEDASLQQTARPRTREIREEIARELVRRGYAPLRPAAVDRTLGGPVPAGHSVLDRKWIDSVAGRCGEDALLAVRVTRWDESSLMNTARIRFAADVSLIDAQSKVVLWSGGFEGEVKAGGVDGPAPLEREARANDAAGRFARQLIQQLPQRTSRFGL